MSFRGIIRHNNKQEKSGSRSLTNAAQEVKMVSTLELLMIGCLFADLAYHKASAVLAFVKGLIAKV